MLYNFLMARCRVSFADYDKLEHAVEVDADSLYEAVGLAVAEFRQDKMLGDFPTPRTEFTVSILKPPVEHKIRLDQVANWAKPSTIGGPAGIVKREKVRKLLGSAD